MNKIYVKVLAEFDTEGKVIPKSIEWYNGKIYEIKKILDVRNAVALKTSGSGIRYTVKIGRQITYLFCEGQNISNHHSFCKWFVEAK